MRLLATELRVAHERASRVEVGLRVARERATEAEVGLWIPHEKATITEAYCQEMERRREAAEKVVHDL